MSSKLYLSVLLTVFVTVSTFAQKYTNTEMSEVIKSYQGHEFSSNKTLSENLKDAKGFSYFSEILENYSEEIFTDEFMGTVFVISDAGVEKVKEENETFDFSDPAYQKFQLQFFTIPGRLDAHAIKKAVEKGGGSASFKTLDGANIVIQKSGDQLYLYGPDNARSRIIATDFFHRHGFFHIVEGPLAPSNNKE